MKRITSILLGALLSVAGNDSSAQLPFAKNDMVVLKIPTVLWRQQSTLGMQLRYEFTVNGGGDSVTVAGFGDWQAAGFPPLTVGQIESIGVDKKTRATRVKINSSSAGRIWLSVSGDVSKGLEAVLAPLNKTEEARAEGYAVLRNKHFTGPLAALADSTKNEILRWADVVARGTTIGSTVFKEKLYLVVDLGTDGSVYNDLKLNQSQRIATIMNDRLLLILKAFAKQIEGSSSLHGLKLELIIPHKSFLNESASPDRDKLEVYVSWQDAKRFAEADITSQQLLDGSIVIVNSNRIQVLLSQ